MYYAKVLLDLSVKFAGANDYVKQLANLDTDRHNFQYMLEFFNNPGFHHRKAMVYTTSSVANAIDSGLLACRFTCEDLRQPLRNSLNFLYKHSELYWTWIDKHPEVVSASTFYNSLYVLLSHLAECEGQHISTTNQTSARLKIFLEYRKIFDSKPEQNSITYIRFYEKLASYHLELGQVEEYMESHRKVIEQTNKHLISCKPRTCKYYEIGFAYRSLGDHKKVVHFLERSLKEGEFSVISQASLLATLLKNYNILNNEGMIWNTTIRLSTLLTQKYSDIPDVDLYRYSSSTTHIITTLRVLGKTLLALELEERLLKVMKSIGGSPESAVSLENAYGVVQHLYDDQNYTRSADLGLFALNSFLQNMNKEQRTTAGHTISKFQVLIAKARFWGGNYSIGLDAFEQMFATALTQQPHNTEIRTEACMYLILRLKYINECYNVAQVILTPFVAMVIVTGDILFSPVVPVDFSTTLANKEVKQPEKFPPLRPLSSHPEISFLSSSSDLSTTGDSDLSTSLVQNLWFIFDYADVTEVLEGHWSLVVAVQLVHAAEKFIRNPVIGILINVSSIWSRLLVFYLLCKLLNSIRRLGIKTVSQHCLYYLLYFVFSVNIAKKYGIVCAVKIMIDPRFDLYIYITEIHEC